MSERAPHPRGEWLEFWAAGSSEPHLILVVDGSEVEIAEAKAAYIHDYIDAAELERRVETALGPRCPCGCGYPLHDRHAQLVDQRHSELAFQGLPPLPGFVPGIGHTLHTYG